MPSYSPSKLFAKHAMGDAQHTTNWPDLAIGLYDRLTGRNAEITYEFQDLHVKVPSGTGTDAEHAEWVVSGTLRIRTRDSASAPN
jgi:hypothetical protein